MGRPATGRKDQNRCEVWLSDEIFAMLNELVDSKKYGKGKKGTISTTIKNLHAEMKGTRKTNKPRKKAPAKKPPVESPAKKMEKAPEITLTISSSDRSDKLKELLNN